MHVAGVALVRGAEAEAAQAVTLGQGDGVEHRRPAQNGWSSLDGHDGVWRGKDRALGVEGLAGVCTLVCGLGVGADQGSAAINTGRKGRNVKRS